ncbi:MAG: protein kinase [Ahniella sp.]|nr:protein kinase [Ahniella sp.]
MEIRLCAVCARWSERGVTRCASCGGAIVLGDESDLLGKELGRYRLTEVIGSGGMGIVFAAEHVGMGREVAVKALLPELDHRDVAERFQREARLLATLVHPHIVGIFDADIGANGLPFYVMERLHGLSLGAALSRVGRPLTPAELVPVFPGVARALDHAHRQQVVHRDLKPENIFLEHTATGTIAKLLDFGIAKRLDQDKDQSRLTQTGAVLGTPLYLSPEQLADEPLVPATDQFALALILVECLTGAPVRECQSPTRMLRLAMQGEVLDETQWQRIPEPLRPALQRALTFEPDRRFPGCFELIEALGLDHLAGDDAWIRSLGLASARSVPTPAPVTTAETTVRVTNGKATVPTPVPTQGNKTTPVPTVALASASPRQRGWLPIVLGATLGVGLLTWIWWRPAAEQPTRSSASTPWPEHAQVLHQTRQWSAPGDAGYLVGAGDGSQALLTTRDGLYLRSLTADTPAVRQSIDGQVLGTTRMGELIVLQGDTVSALDARGKESRERVLGSVADSASWISVDRAGEWLAWIDSGRLTWAHAVNEQQGGQQDLGGAKVSFLRVEAGIAAMTLEDPRELLVIRLSDGMLLYRQAHNQGRVYDLAMMPEQGKVALCGFSPEVEVFDWIEASLPRTVPVATHCAAAIWLPDGPGLLIRADRQLVLWQPSSRQQLPWPGRAIGPGGDLPRFARASGTVWLHEPSEQTLTGFTVGPQSWPGLNEPTGSEAWDLAMDNDRIYIGLSNGALQVIEPTGTRTLKVHEAGITDLVDGGDAIASASDDRTMAIWSKPGMEVSWRSRGHEFLINQLWIAPDRSSVWSTSSDGQMKQWRWPDLSPMTQVNTRELIGEENLSLHAIWMNAAQDLALLGTWNHQLLLLGKTDDTWSAAATPVPSGGGYRLLELPDLDVVLLLGVYPGTLHAFDLRQQKFVPLPDYGIDLFGLSTGPEAGTAVAAGDGALILLRFHRDAEQTLHWQHRARQAPAFGVIHAVVMDAPKQRLLLANGEGVVFAVPAAQLLFPRRE